MQLVLFITNCMNINLSFFLAFFFFKKLASHLLADLNSFSARVNWFSGAFSMWLMTPTMLFSLPTAEYVLSSFSSSSNRDTVMLMSRSVKRDVSIVCWNSCSAISSAEPEIQDMYNKRKSDTRYTAIQKNIRPVLFSPLSTYL